MPAVLVDGLIMPVEAVIVKPVVDVYVPPLVKLLVVGDADVTVEQ